jgi:hypothetical protein
MDWLQSFDHAAMSRDGVIFLRLSYKDLPPDSAESHRGLNNFLDRLEYRLNNPVIVWRQEFGERFGRLHFHLMIYAMPPEWAEKDKRDSVLAEMWQEASAPYGGFIHQVEVSTAEHVGRYISKYVGKPVDTAPASGAGVPAGRGGATEAGAECANLLKAHILGKHVWQGRSWGIRGRDKIILARSQVLDIQVDDTSTAAVRRLKWMNIAFMRIARNWVKANNRKSTKRLAGQLFNMRPDKLRKALARKNAHGVRLSAISRGEDWAERCAVRLKGKARDGFLKWRGGDWPRYTLYTGPGFDFFGVMEWIGANLPESKGMRSAHIARDYRDGPDGETGTGTGGRQAQ